MDKKIIAVSLSGVFIDKKHFSEPHEFGMKELAEKSGMPEVLKAVNSPDYFSKVEEALEVIYPGLSVGERIAKRRKIYLGRVLESIRKGEEISEEVLETFRNLKREYEIALVTTVTKRFCDEILKGLGLEKFFDYVFTSEETEKDDKKAVFDRMIGGIGKPEIYFSYSERDKKICKEMGIKFVGSLKELKKIVG